MYELSNLHFFTHLVITMKVKENVKPLQYYRRSADAAWAAFELTQDQQVKYDTIQYDGILSLSMIKY